MEHLTVDSFKEKIFDFESGSQWLYKGDLPCIVDFYADWCGPCKMLSPLMDELSREYEGKVAIYKVNTESEGELASLFGVTGIPSILFIPMEGKPQMAAGALPKEVLKDAIRDVLKVH